MGDDFTFAGFETPKTVPIPNAFFDELLSVLSGAELKAMLYIFRRTLGWNKRVDAISLNQFQKGITTKGEKVLDHGCGIKDRKTLCDALHNLEHKWHCIKSEKVLNDKGEYETTIYYLNFKDGEQESTEEGSGKNQPPVVGKTNHRGLEKPTTRSGKNQPTRNNTTRNNTTEEAEDSTSPKDTVIVTENPPPPSILSSGLETPETQEKPEEKEIVSDGLLIEQMVAYSAEKNRETYTANEKRLLVSTATQILHDFPTLTLDQFKFSFDDWYKFVIGKRKTRLPMNYLLDTQQNNGIVRLQASLTLWEANQRRAQMHVVSSSTNAAEEIDGVASLLKSFPHLNLISASEPARRGSL